MSAPNPKPEDLDRNGDLYIPVSVPKRPVRREEMSYQQGDESRQMRSLSTAKKFNGSSIRSVYTFASTASTSTSTSPSKGANQPPTPAPWKSVEQASNLPPLVSLKFPNPPLTPFHDLTIAKFSPSEPIPVSKPCLRHTSTLPSSRTPPSSFPASLHPDADVVHHYTHCTHVSPPKTRPLNVQPTVIYSTASGTPQSTLLGRCYECDVVHRRELEGESLASYRRREGELYDRVLAAKRELAGDAGVEVDVEGLAAEIEELVQVRESAVRKIWHGFPARWGPGTIHSNGEGSKSGRVDVKWIRPEKADK